MDYPATLQHVNHKNGGKIVTITGIHHDTAPPKHGRSQDVWFFKGDIEWRDGTRSTGLEIPPYAVCYVGEENRAELDELLADLNTYLLDHGDWCESETKHSGWYARDRPAPKAKRRAGGGR